MEFSIFSSSGSRQKWKIGRETCICYPYMFDLFLWKKFCFLNTAVKHCMYCWGVLCSYRNVGNPSIRKYFSMVVSSKFYEIPFTSRRCSNFFFVHTGFSRLCEQEVCEQQETAGLIYKRYEDLFPSKLMIAFHVHSSYSLNLKEE